MTISKYATDYGPRSCYAYYILTSPPIHSAPLSTIHGSAQQSYAFELWEPLPVPSVVNWTIRLTYCSTIITGYLQELFTHNNNLTDTFMFRKKFGLLIANKIQFHLCSKGYKVPFLLNILMTCVYKDHQPFMY